MWQWAREYYGELRAGLIGKIAVSIPLALGGLYIGNLFEVGLNRLVVDCHKNPGGGSTLLEIEVENTGQSALRGLHGMLSWSSRAQVSVSPQRMREWTSVDGDSLVGNDRGMSLSIALPDTELLQPRQPILIRLYTAGANELDEGGRVPSRFSAEFRQTIQGQQRDFEALNSLRRPVGVWVSVAFGVLLVATLILGVRVYGAIRFAGREGEADGNGEA